MRSHASPRRPGLALAGAALWLALLASPAGAQVSIDPTASAPLDDGGWVYQMAIGAIILGAIAVLAAGAMYLRFAPRFQREEEEPRGAGLRAAEPAVTLQRAWSQPRPVVAPEPVPAPQPQAAPVPAGVGGAAPAATPASAPAAAPAAAAPAAAAPTAAAQAAPRPAAPARPKGEPIEQDQETYDRVLQEELGKGTDRRVAEGRAKSAAVRAARAKAGG
jgi:hypothetical protein